MPESGYFIKKRSLFQLRFWRCKDRTASDDGLLFGGQNLEVASSITWQKTGSMSEDVCLTGVSVSVSLSFSPYKAIRTQLCSLLPNGLSVLTTSPKTLNTLNPSLSSQF
jgi:hypothetical protein